VQRRVVPARSVDIGLEVAKQGATLEKVKMRFTATVRRAEPRNPTRYTGHGLYRMFLLVLVPPHVITKPSAVKGGM